MGINYEKATGQCSHFQIIESSIPTFLIQRIKAIKEHPLIKAKGQVCNTKEKERATSQPARERASSINFTFSPGP